MLDFNHQVDAEIAVPSVEVPGTAQATAAAERPHEFLAGAGILLASSLEYEAVLGQVVRLIVPVLADWCVVYLLDQDLTVRPIATAHADAEREALVRMLQTAYPDTVDLPGLVPDVLRSRQSAISPTLTDQDLAAAARDQRQLELLRTLGLRSQLCVPLIARGRVLGAISFHSATPGRFQQVDLALAEDLARRAALAVDNAFLYREAQHSKELMARIGRILDDASDEIYIVAADSLRLQQANQTACVNTGYSNDELQAMTLADLLAGPPAGGLTAFVTQLESGESESVGFEAVQRRKDGTCYPVEARLRRSRAEDPPVLVAIVTNIHSRKAAERRADIHHAVTQVLATATSLAAVAPDVLRAIGECLGWDFAAWWMLDSETNRLTCYTTWYVDLPAFEDLAATARSAAFAPGEGFIGDVWQAGQPIWLTSAPSDANPVRLHAAERAGLASGFGFPIVSRGAVLGVIELHTRQFHAEDLPLLKLMGSLGGEIGQFVDRDRAQQALRDHNERYRALAFENTRLLRESREAIRARDEFLAVVSHDLKNPLVSIKGRAQMLQRRLARDYPKLDPRVRDGLAAIDASATKMTDQINELLDVTRIQMQSQIELRRQPVDLVALLVRVVAEQQQATARHRIRIEAAEDEIVGQWDSARLERVAGNLLSNAIKYSPDGGEIVVSIRRIEEHETDWAEFSVRDHGIGIPAADLPLIFQRFRRAGNVGNISGTGVGLAGAQRIVERHGGTIAVESEEAAGTTFTVRLPLDSPAA